MSQSCCQPIKSKRPTGFIPGLLYGLLPHTFCIAFVIFSVVGATAATTVFKKILMMPYFFQLLVVISFIFATISAFIYLKRKNNLNKQGIKTNRTYLLVLYGTTIGINLLFFLVVFPMTANFKSKRPSVLASQTASVATLKVAIPCSGHAPLITEELGKIKGIGDVEFRLPNYFDIQFDKSRVSLNEILEIEIFKTYKAEISN